jgi:hypothetical protein
MTLKATLNKREILCVERDLWYRDVGSYCVLEFDSDHFIMMT